MTFKHCFIALAAAATLSACGGSTGKSPVAAADSNSSDWDALIEKYNAYIGLHNRVSRDARNSYREYSSFADPQQGVKKADHLPTLYEISPGNTLQEAEAALAAKPSLDSVDAQMKDFLAATKELMAINNEAKAYYERKNYKDDNFVKANEMNPRMFAAFDKFFTINSKVDNSLDALEDQITSKELEVYKKEGKDWEYEYGLLKQQAKKVMTFCSEPEDIMQLDLAKLEPMVNSFEQQYNKADQLYKAKEAKGESPRFARMSDAEDFLKAAKDIMRRVRDKKPYSQSEIMLLQSNSTSVDGSIAQLVSEYNGFIR